VTSSGDLYLWSVKNPKGWSTLAPGFTEVHDNFEYVEREDEFDLPDESTSKFTKKKKVGKIDIKGGDQESNVIKHTQMICFKKGYNNVTHKEWKMIPCSLE